MVKTSELVTYVNELLEVARFRDYCPNGLQIEGRSEVKRIITGVTASHSLIEKAVEHGADMIIVHHGYFWKNENAEIVGMKKRRIASLLRHEINLAAYHLPLDAHPDYGNNAQLAKVLGISIEGRLDGEAELLFYGALQKPLSAGELAAHLESVLDREPLVIDARDQPISRVAWCTGGAQSYIEYARQAGVDAFITGEASEQTFHFAVENKLDFFAAGHHATERYGVRALGEHLAARFGIEHVFVDIHNPI